MLLSTRKSKLKLLIHADRENIYLNNPMSIQMMESNTQTIEAVYEDNVLKPIKPLKGIMEHENVVVTVRPLPARKGLRDVAGTLTHNEAKEMQKLIDEEFEKIEGEW